MKAIEEVAREAAERLVRGGTHVLCDRPLEWVFVDDEPIFEPEERSSDAVEELRGLITPAIAAAIEGYCRQGVTSPGMTDGRLKEIEAADGAATKGPWLWTHDYLKSNGTRLWCISTAPDASDCVYPLVTVASDEGWADNPDAAFVALARSAVPELLAEVYFLRRLMADDLDRGVVKELAQARAECARLRGALQRIADREWDVPGHWDSSGQWEAAKIVREALEGA